MKYVVKQHIYLQVSLRYIFKDLKRCYQEPGEYFRLEMNTISRDLTKSDCEDA